jgi:tetratricopeptide (TPR) repeat protein
MKLNKLILLIYYFLFFSLLLNNNLFSQSSRALEFFKSGIESEKSENYEDAIFYFTLTIESEPNYYDAYSHRGYSNLKMNYYNQTLKDFTKILMLRFNAANFINRAKVYLKMNDFNNASKDLANAIALDSNSYEAYYYVGSIHYYLSEFDSALVNFLKSVKIKPGYQDALDKLALLQTQDKSVAKIDFQEREQFSEDIVVEQPKIEKPIVDVKNDISVKINTTKNINTDKYKYSDLHKEPQKEIDTTVLLIDNLKEKPFVTEIKEVPKPITQNENQTPQHTTEKVLTENSKDISPVVNIKVAPKQITQNDNQLQESEKVIPEKSTEVTPVNEINEGPKPITQNEKQTPQQITEKVLPDNPKEISPVVYLNEESKPITQNEKQIQKPELLSEIKEKNEPFITNENQLQVSVNKYIKKPEEEESVIRKEEKPIDTYQTKSKGFEIQIGAFDQEINAVRCIEKVKENLDFEVNYFLISGFYKVRIRSFSKEEALELIKRVKENGFSDAYIIVSNK